MNNRKYIILLTILISQSSFAQIKFNKTSIKASFEQAKREHKAVFVEIYADGCHHCEAFKATFDANKAVGEFNNQNFVSYQVEVNSEEGRKFRAERNIYVMSIAHLTTLFVATKRD